MDAKVTVSFGGDGNPNLLFIFNQWSIAFIIGIRVKRLVKLHGSKDYGINYYGILTEPN